MIFYVKEHVNCSIYVSESTQTKKCQLVLINHLKVCNETLYFVITQSLQICFHLTFNGRHIFEHLKISRI
jgi:hypothetical protein